MEKEVIDILVNRLIDELHFGYEVEESIYEIAEKVKGELREEEEKFTETEKEILRYMYNNMYTASKLFDAEIDSNSIFSLFEKLNVIDIIF